LRCHFLKQQRPSLGDEFSYLDDAVINHLMNGLGLIYIHTAVDELLPSTSLCGGAVSAFFKHPGADLAAMAVP
jgi:hypothetical protein